MTRPPIQEEVEPYSDFVERLKGVIVEEDPNFVDLDFTQDLIQPRQISTAYSSYPKTQNKDNSYLDARSSSTASQSTRLQQRQSIQDSHT